jgi:hypothetical protein
MFAAKARKNVENARLMLDSVKASKKAAAHGDLDNLSEDARAEIEQAEDEFVGQTEEAVSVMKNVSRFSSLLFCLLLLFYVPSLVLTSPHIRCLIPPNLCAIWPI